MKAFIKISKEAWEARQCVTRLETMHAAPERLMNETVRMKLKIQWKLQRLRDAQNVQYLPRKLQKAAESVKERGHVDFNQESHKGRAAQILWRSYLIAICPRCQEIAIVLVCTNRLQSYFGPITSSYVLIPLFWSGNSYFIYCMHVACF